MEQKIIIKHLLIIVMSLVINLGYSQTNKDFYTLSKDGKKYKKIVGYIMLDDNVRKVNKNENTVYYYINQARLEYRKKDHLITICNSKDVNQLNITTLGELGKIESKELERRLQEENIKKYPRPFHHKILKIFLLERIDFQGFRKIEVEWKYLLK